MADGTRGHPNQQQNSLGHSDSAQAQMSTVPKKSSTQTKGPYLGPLQPTVPRKPQGLSAKEAELARGPGAYASPRGIGQQPVSTRRSGPAYSFGSRSPRRIEKSRQTALGLQPTYTSKYASTYRTESTFLKQAESRKPSAPSTRFGTSERFPDVRPEIAERPHTYVSVKTLAEENAKKSLWSSSAGLGGTSRRPALSISELRVDEPGPGHYVGLSDAAGFDKAAAKQSKVRYFGTSTREAALKGTGMSSVLGAQSSPGPGVYYPKDPSREAKSRAHSFGVRPLHFTELPSGKRKSAEPAPGTYSPTPPSKPRGPKIVSTNTPLRKQYIQPGPGPGAHDPKPVESRRGRFSFGTSTRESHSKVFKSRAHASTVLHAGAM